MNLIKTKDIFLIRKEVRHKNHYKIEIEVIKEFDLSNFVLGEKIILLRHFVTDRYEWLPIKNRYFSKDCFIKIEDYRDRKLKEILS